MAFEGSQIMAKPDLSPLSPGEPLLNRDRMGAATNKELAHAVTSNKSLAENTKGLRHAGGGASQAIGERGGRVAQTFPPCRLAHHGGLFFTTKQYNAFLPLQPEILPNHRKQDVDF
jgi:hypothetical protein